MVNLITQPHTSNNVSQKRRKYINRLQETNGIYYQGTDALMKFVNRQFLREIYLKRSYVFLFQ